MLLLTILNRVEQRIAPKTTDIGIGTVKRDATTTVLLWLLMLLCGLFGQKHDKEHTNKKQTSLMVLLF